MEAKGVDASTDETPTLVLPGHLHCWREWGGALLSWGKDRKIKGFWVCGEEQIKVGRLEVLEDSRRIQVQGGTLRYWADT